MVARTARPLGDGIVVMTRRHIDGIAFRQQARSLVPFFAVASVVDPAR